MRNNWVKGFINIRSQVPSNRLAR